VKFFHERERTVLYLVPVYEDSYIDTSCEQFALKTTLSGGNMQLTIGISTQRLRPFVAFNAPGKRVMIFPQAKREIFSRLIQIQWSLVAEKTLYLVIEQKEESAVLQLLVRESNPESGEIFQNLGVLPNIDTFEEHVGTQLEIKRLRAGREKKETDEGTVLGIWNADFDLWSIKFYPNVYGVRDIGEATGSFWVFENKHRGMYLIPV
jgi:hypothetical protein